MTKTLTEIQQADAMRRQAARITELTSRVMDAEQRAERAEKEVELLKARRDSLEDKLRRMQLCVETIKGTIQFMKG